ncbi:MAG: hypothetical protein J7L47_10205 [Candidatus Odinarchaeota archaeon]|nr:hypothetical protein [Candidatus Odinarchaeota archaeon]
MGKIDKGVLCSIEGCAEKAVRSLSLGKLSGIDIRPLKLKPHKGSRIYLCEKHYKEIRKKIRKMEKLERMRFKGF